MWIQRIVLLTVFPVVLTACGQSDAQRVASNPAVAKENSAQQTAIKTSVSRVTREPALNAAPLGLEVGYATLGGVKEKLGGLTQLEEQGTNQYSGGMMLSSDGEGLGIDGLSKLLLLFDQSDVLVGVIMTMPKDPTGIYQKLSGKYKTAENHIDAFMNKGSARLEKGDSWVEIDAPHLSFEMSVLYMTKQLDSDFEKQSAEEENLKQQKLADKL